MRLLLIKRLRLRVCIVWCSRCAMRVKQRAREYTKGIRIKIQLLKRYDCERRDGRRRARKSCSVRQTRLLSLSDCKRSL